MRNNKCASCLFGGTCAYNTGCEHYYPIDDDIIDDVLNQETEESRSEYWSAWQSYIANNA